MGWFIKDQIDQFIKEHTKAVVATVDEKGQPNTSTIYYVMTKSGDLEFITKSETSKFKNLLQNSRASLTIEDQDKPITVNIEGSLVIIDNDSEKDAVLQEVSKIAQKQLNDYAPIFKLSKGSFRALKFIPSQAKMIDFTKSSNESRETYKKY